MDDEQPEHDDGEDHAGEQQPLDAVFNRVEDEERQQRYKQEQKQRPQQRMPKPHLD